MEKDVKNKLEKIKVIKKDTDVKALSDFIDNYGLVFAGKSDKQGIINRLAFLMLPYYNKERYDELLSEIGRLKPNKRLLAANKAFDAIKDKVSFLLGRNPYCMKQRIGVFGCDSLIATISENAYKEWISVAAFLKQTYNIDVVLLDHSYDSNYGIVLVCEDDNLSSVFAKTAKL